MLVTIPSGSWEPTIVLPLLTRVDHVGIACRDLEVAIARYEATFGLQVVSREVNEAQGVREAMLAVGAVHMAAAAAVHMAAAAAVHMAAAAAGMRGPVTFSCWSRWGRTPRWAGSWLAVARACTTWGTVWKISARHWPRSAGPGCGCSMSGPGTGPWERRSRSCTRPIWGAC